MFELCEDLFDGVEVGAVWRQEQKSCAGGADGASDVGAFVRAEIVEDDDVAFSERRREHLLDVGGEALAIDGSVEDERRVDPVAAQRRDERHGFPMPMRSLGHQSAALWTPAAQRRHVRLDPGLVDEHEARRIDAGLPRLPALAFACDVRTILLAGEQAFFEAQMSKF